MIHYGFDFRDSEMFGNLTAFFLLFLGCLYMSVRRLGRFFGFAENRKPKNRKKYEKPEKIRKIEGKKAQTPLISNPQIALDSPYMPSSVMAGTNQMCR